MFAAYHDSEPETITSPSISIRDGTEGVVKFWGGGVTVDLHGFKTTISLFKYFSFSANEYSVVCDLPWKVSTPVTV